MKILHITDSHGTVKSPEGRKDIYYLSFLKKMYELKYVIQQNNIKLIIHTGDLFHSSRVSDKFTGQLAEIIKSYGIPMYVVPGNHDIDGYSINTLDQTKLGLLYKTGVVKRLDRDRNPIQLKSQKENLTINIAGQEYYKDIDHGNMSDFEMRTTSNSDVNILAIHGYLCNTPQHPNIICTQCKDIVTDADIILSGHFHESFEYHGVDFDVYNPGSMMRVEQTTYNKNHMPQYGILEITNNNGQVQHNYSFHEFKIAEPSDKVFDYSQKIQKQKILISLENFKNSITNTNLNTNLNTSIENIINDVANNMSVTEEVIVRTLNAYNNAFNNSPDKLEVQQGFICDTVPKFISSVEIHNFQSHEDTFIKFKNGLNAIIGESNNGKTSILRAIRWCLDNNPSGSDFITTGHKDCKVTVSFSDGTIITRKRTRTDAGTYEVTGKTVQPDGTETYWNDTYKGFANNLPIEITNIHQMPKINLTKDICTHLNMMSQLDGPFLVTDSPQVRAAIIGRLTGTQIIDLAIKETNKTILSNSKEIKIYTKDKEDREKELEKYKDLVYFEQFIKLYESLYAFLRKEDSKIKDIRSRVSENYARENVISQYQQEIDKIELQIKTIKYILVVEQYLAYIMETLDVFNTFKELSDDIDTLSKKIKWLSVLISFKPFIENVSLSIKNHTIINDVYNRLSTLEDLIKHDKDSLNKCSNSININNQMISGYVNILRYINVLTKDVNNTKPAYNKRVKCQENINYYKGTIDQMIVEYNHLHSQIDKLVLQQEEVIKNNDICPCCGRKLTAKKQIENINNFMKGIKHG